MRAWRQLGRRVNLHRMAAVLLLLLLAGDLGLHVGEAFFAPPHTAADAGVQLSGTRIAPHPDESNCPLPGHAGGRFHHHHFPGIVTALSEFDPTRLQRQENQGVRRQAGSAARIAHRGRGPPIV